MKIKCYDYALLLLDYNNRPEKELHSRLKNKGYAEEDIEDTVSKLKFYNLIDDKIYAENYIKSQTEKLKGKKLIISNLLQKGISRDIIEEVFGYNENHDQELEKAKRLLAKSKFISKSKNNIIKPDKIANYLKTRGYSFSIICEIIKLHSKKDNSELIIDS
ncbi:MAG: regulatory protein RecX [bacterium]